MFTLSHRFFSVKITRNNKRKYLKLETLAGGNIYSIRILDTNMVKLKRAAVKLAAVFNCKIDKGIHICNKLSYLYRLSISKRFIVVTKPAFLL